MPSSFVVATEPPVVAAVAPADATTLTVGACDLGAKELVLLRSLLRLLDGADGLRLTHAEPAEACRVVFVPARWARRLPPSCVVVRVLELADDDPVGPGLQVHAPLRSSNVAAVLRAAASLIAQGEPPPSAPCDGLVDLFQLIARHLAARERRCTGVPLDGRGMLVLDFEAGLAHAALPLTTLLAGTYRVGAPARATPAERDAAAALPALPIAELFWRAAQRLGDEGRTGTPMPGRLRLARWPDAVALSRPGLPRLAALWTGHAMSIAEAAAASGLPEPAVYWFLQACLALGLARPCAGETPAVAAAPPVARAAATSPVPRSLLGRLRQHLKLW